MRLRSYTAASMAQAMEQIRQELGDDAIIISSQLEPDRKSVLVTAALDAPDEITCFSRALDEPAHDPDLSSLAFVLSDHGIPAGIMDELMDASWDAGTAKAELALAAALDLRFRFSPLCHEKTIRPTMLVGPPGAGKSTTVAKLAARASLAGKAVDLITTDTVRAGGIDQLKAFADILEVPLHVAESAEAVAQAVQKSASGGRIFIDSPGVNPFQGKAMAELAMTVSAAGAEPVLVLAAGGDPAEMADTASAFANIGVSRMIVTRLDTARRYGGVLAAADQRLKFCEMSFRPQVADGLSPVNPVNLARLLMNHITPDERAGSGKEDHQ